MKFSKYIDEAAYKGNLGFEEMARFYQVANDQEISEMEEILKNSDWKEFKKLIQRVLGVNLF